MVLVSTFLFNLLCAITPCDFTQNPTSARISRSYYTNRKADGKLGLENEYPIVTTKYGQVQGYSMGTLQEKRIFAFEGIRYGQPPVNQNRFRAPLPAKPWQGIYRAHKPGPMCLQLHPAMMFRVVGSEDCLFLNIYVPGSSEIGKDKTKSSEPTAEKLPVIIYVHGGAFIFGEGAEYGPAYLVDREVILVTINYRLGPLGFLSTGDSVSPGNNGLKDQALAIKWVAENIAEFGGDSNQVTLVGQSAGAVSSHIHLLSTQTRQYFQKVISMSGSAFLHWALRSKGDGKKYSIKFAKIAGCPTENSEMMIRCLRGKNPAFLVGYQLKMFNWLVLPPVLFSPVIEPESPTAFITDTPQNLYDRNEVAKYPWICSMTSEEGYMLIYVLLVFQMLGRFRRNFSQLLPAVLDYEHLVKNTTQIDAAVQKFYLGDESARDVPISTLARIGTDRYFTNGIVKGIRMHSQVAPTYSYLFSYRGRFNMGKSLFGRWNDELGIGHTEDAAYFFNSTRFFEGLKKHDEEYQLSSIMTNVVNNFARKGEPLYTNEEGVDLKLWERVEPNLVRFLQIDKEIRMVENPFEERIKFWENLNLTDTTPFRPRPNNDLDSGVVDNQIVI